MSVYIAIDAIISADIDLPPRWYCRTGYVCFTERIDLPPCAQMY